MKQIFIVLLLLVQSFAFGQNTDTKVKAPLNADTIAKLKSYVMANQNDLAAHGKYIKYIGADSPELAAQYDIWLKQYPKSSIFPFAIGEALANMESPKAKPWLLKAVAVDPKMAKAYFYLWIDGERWGDFTASRDYLKKAMESDPASADYAFYYRSSFKDSDPVRYRQGMLEMPKLFPGTERGAQSLYWLGLFVKDDNEKQDVYNQLKNNFPPDKSNWSSSGMYDFYYLYLRIAPEKAADLALYMAALPIRDSEKKSWNDRVKIAQDMVKVRTLMSEKKAAEALTVLEASPSERRSGAADMITLLKAELADATGNTLSAYNKLVSYYAGNPADNIREAIDKYAKKLGKGVDGLFADIWKLRDSLAVPATPVSFDLEQYFKQGKASLGDFKGKVILLTYWFPGCGPCRGEFPNFQNVVNKFSKDKLVYIGINISPEQDEYVVPFMKLSGYSFIPLKGEDSKQGNLVARGAPTNYLLDQNGRIIFKNFRTDTNNERTLELMIKETLEHVVTK